MYSGKQRSMFYSCGYTENIETNSTTLHLIKEQKKIIKKRCTEVIKISYSKIQTQDLIYAYNKTLSAQNSHLKKLS